MALGDGIRRNIAHVDPAERTAFVQAVLDLHGTPLYPGGPSMWTIQDLIHEATHVHGGAAFLPWHRELCNRFEEMLRIVNPDLSLHYWDWTEDPRAASDGQGGVVDLFTTAFMGSASGSAGDPLTPLGAITRGLAAGAPGLASDASLLASADSLAQADQFPQFRLALESAHDGAHTYFGMDSTIGNAHTAFEDPFVFLLHSNVDRLFAMWQAAPGQEWRLDPAQVYGTEGSTGGVNGILTPMEPWAGVTTSLRPWAPPENQQVSKDSRHPSVVRPPCYDTLPVSVTRTVPSVDGAPITFNAVPEGITVARAAVFHVRVCMPLAFTVTAGPGAPFVLDGISPPVTAPDALLQDEVRVWILYTGTVAGDIAGSSITIRCDVLDLEWVIPIVAETVAWPKVASALVLDHSGSMDWASGVPGQKRMDVLKAAAPVYVQLMPDDHGIGVVRFDHDATPAAPLQTAGVPVIGAGRAAAAGAIAGLVPAGGTSIGDGVVAARAMVDPAAGYDDKAIVVFTDGHETAERYLSHPDVVDALNARIFALGLGTAEFLNPVALSTLVSGTGGFMLMTGALGSDDLLRVHKFFVQILAGVTRTATVLDPEGRLYPGQEHRIPFELGPADALADVLLLSPAPDVIEFLLETPSGARLDPAGAAGVPGAAFVSGGQVNYYRLALPIAMDEEEHAGRWHAILRLRRRDQPLTHVREKDGAQPGAGLPYSLNVQARSSLRMDARVLQASHVPGAEVGLRAVLTEYEQPLAGRARVEVAVVRPDGTATTVVLDEDEPGIFTGRFAAVLPGIYPLTFRAAGKTWHGGDFTREEFRTAAVWRRGDDPAPVGTGGAPGAGRDLCELFRCLARDSGVQSLLKRNGIRPDALARCLCGGAHDPGPVPPPVEPGRLPGCLGSLTPAIFRRG